MNENPKNSGTEIVHGIERKFGIAVLTIVFIILFFGGAFLLWERNRNIEERRDLLAESSQLEALVTQMQESAATSAELAPIEEVDTSQYQTISLENGDMIVGKVIDNGSDALTIEKPVTLHSQAQNASSEVPKLSMNVNRKDVSFLKNVRSDSALVKMLWGEKNE